MTYGLDELDVRKAVLPGDASEALTTSKGGGVGGTALESGNVGGDHALDTAIVKGIMVACFKKDPW